jgi:hypothetical protein
MILSDHGTVYQKEHDMTEEQNPNEGPRGTNDAWQEVGRQFQALGESISQAFRTAWQDEENRRRMEQMRDGLQSMVNEVGRTIDESAHSPQGQRVISEAERAAKNLRDASEQTVQDVRPHLVSALRQVNVELQKLVDRMDQGPKQPPDDHYGGPAT